MEVGYSTQTTTAESYQQAAAAAFSPLPAYDGIGGSPSYYCENAQVSRRPRRNSGRSRPKSNARNSRQAEGDDGQENSPGKPVIRAIREDFEENEDALGDQQAHVNSEAPVRSAHEPATSSSKDEYDPMYLMMQLFDLTVENRPHLLTDGPSLDLALSVLDRTPEYETHKIGLLYVRDEKQTSESAILGTTGGLDTASNSDGKFGLVYKDSCAQIMFHVATMMVPENDRPAGTPAIGNFASMKKKRHIGNDFVHIVFKECDEDYDLQTLSGQFNDVHIVMQPLNDLQYRTEVHVKPGIPPFGPLYGRQIVSSSIISESVRLTCLNANLACQVFHQDLVGFALNCEERLKQIKQLGIRLATADEWKVDG
ncbi:ATPase WRNIP1 [Phytophthora cinnamomi]|uniref:ATPase WRNIP1 n=1 Tax=Phytophthora cinnamomi TaxID=4785 RepID=UPI003559CDC2|nr:ATPase WRNIP1 [Phytophthora cinnamomi]